MEQIKVLAAETFPKVIFLPYNEKLTMTKD